MTLKTPNGLVFQTHRRHHGQQSVIHSLRVGAQFPIVNPRHGRGSMIPKTRAGKR